MMHIMNSSQTLYPTTWCSNCGYKLAHCHIHNALSKPVHNTTTNPNPNPNPNPNWSQSQSQPPLLCSHCHNIKMDDFNLACHTIGPEHMACHTHCLHLVQSTWLAVCLIDLTNICSVFVWIRPLFAQCLICHFADEAHKAETRVRS